MRLSSAPLEDWIRRYYFTTTIDLGSSGVEPWSFPELRALAGITDADLDQVVFRDTDSFGSASLRAAVAGRWYDGDPDRVMVTHGSTEAIFLVVTALVDRGDEVVVLDPCYHALSAVAEGVGGVLRRWTLRPEDGYTPDLAALRAQLSERTRMVIVNFPHNPTGTTLPPDQAEELVDLCAEHGAYLVWDGAFSELTYTSEPLPDPAARYERCVSIGTLSKAYGLPGLRVGWCVAPPAVRELLLPLRDRLTLCLSPVSELIATAAVTQADALLHPRLKQAARNLETLASWAAARPHVLAWVPPQGGVTAFPGLRVPDVDVFCDRLARDRDVMLVPGSAFGRAGRIRLGFGGDTGDFTEGLGRFASALELSD